MFENHVWKNVEDGINLRKLISTEIITRLRSKDREIDRELTKLRKTYYNDDREDAWAGIIKYAIMKPKYEYSYSFKKDYLKIDDKKFEK